MARIVQRSRLHGRLRLVLAVNDFVERLRAFEHRCQAAAKDIRCPVHLSLGQEQAAAQLAGVLTADDWLFSTHRNHAHYLAKGGSEQRLWDEIMGLESGVNGGFAGSQCFSDLSINFHSTAIVGGLVAAAAGVALALQLSKSTAIAVCCIGDAVPEQGVFWETLNFADLRGLPLLFVMENNGYSVHVPLNERQAGSMAERALAFGLAYVQEDVPAAVREVRTMGRPALVEVMCTRDCSHIIGMGDFR